VEAAAPQIVPQVLMLLPAGWNTSIRGWTCRVVLCP
jgi:hypothetical protein